MPCFCSSRRAGGYTGLPISSVLTAAEAISNFSANPRLATMSFRINSPIGLRQMLPWHTNKILTILRSRLLLGLWDDYSTDWRMLHGKFILLLIDLR